MKISQFMATNPVALEEDYTIKQAAEVFLNHRIDGAPVLDGQGKIKGLFTKKHLYRAFVNGIDSATKVSALMKTSVVTIDPDSSADKAWHKAQKEQVGRFPVVDKDGNLVAMVTRTNLVQAFEHYMMESINRLNAILDSAHNGIYAIDRDGIIVACNKSAERLIGLKSGEVVGKNITSFNFDQDIMEILKSGRPQFGEKIVLNGSLMLSNRTPIISGDMVMGAVAVIQDISELESVSRELNETVELYEELQAIINSSYDGIVVVDRHGKIIQRNKAYKKMGQDLNKVINELSQKAFTKNKPATLAHHLPDGRELLLTANPVRGGNDRGITKLVINCRDISELNNLRREVETSKELSKIYHQELEVLRTKHLGDTIVCNSPVMLNVLELAIRVARVDSTILLLGESGVGKDVVTRLIHRESKRINAPFIRINCGAIPENLLESELFGYNPGAFTGARREGKPGLLELAHNGTLFLDEVAELPLPLQVKLLNVIQEREVTRLGGVKPVSVDIRLIAATNKNLESLVEKGQFRADLFYRLNVVPITIPPLRERNSDIPFLVIHFLKKFNEKYKLTKNISAGVMDCLVNYSWPGNVRELENLIERMVVITPHDIISRQDLPGALLRRSRKRTSRTGEKAGSEREIIEKLYRKMQSTRKVAEALGVNQSTVVRKMKKYNITPVKV